MNVERENPYLITDEWEIGAITQSKTHTTLHPALPPGAPQSPGVTIEGVLHFAVGARVRFTVEEIPEATEPKVPPSVRRKQERAALRGATGVPS
jgi:hypothetical protein